MMNAIRRWQHNTSRFKLHLALIGVLLIGACFAYGGASWYYTVQMDRQDVLYSQQIASLANVLDVNARNTLGRLDNLTDKVEFLVAEVSKLVPQVQDATQKAQEAVQGVQDKGRG